MYLSEIKRMLLKVNDVKTMHFIYVIIKDALEDLDGWETEDMFCNLNHHSIGTGGITLEEKKKKEELIEMIKNIENADTIKYLHTFIKTFLEEWG